MRKASPRSKRDSFDDHGSLFAQAISGARVVPLPSSKVAFVDEEDFNLVSVSSWSMEGGYAKRTKTINAPVGLMHCLLMGTREGYEVDHIDGNRSNNRRHNLRWATRRENCLNRSVRSDSKSRLKGIHFRSGKWVARMLIGDKMKAVGKFPSLEEAVSCYNKYASDLHGKFAKLHTNELGGVI